MPPDRLPLLRPAGVFPAPAIQRGGRAHQAQHGRIQPAFALGHAQQIIHAVVLVARLVAENARDTFPFAVGDKPLLAQADEADALAVKKSLAIRPARGCLR